MEIPDNDVVRLCCGERLNSAKTIGLIATVICLALLPAYGGPISFSGQFDPSLATVSLGGGNGSFDASSAPLAVTIWGSDSDQKMEIATLVTWSITSSVTNLWLAWQYWTNDESPLYDPAGYYLNGDFQQLTDDNGANSQAGMVTIASLSPGDVFGFYVTATDDCCGAASITISGVPEPGTFALLGLGGFGLLAWRRLKSARN
ncbi:MAG: PEP-CTERM sorting domain-containing protein [Bryobacteraceae bacterium]